MILPGVWIQPTYLLGLVLFLALFVVCVELIGYRPPQRRLGLWLLLALLTAACAGMKQPALTAVAGALAGPIAWRLVVERRLDVPAVGALGLTAVASWLHTSGNSTTCRVGSVSTRFLRWSS